MQFNAEQFSQILKEFFDSKDISTHILYWKGLLSQKNTLEFEFSNNNQSSFLKFSFVLDLWKESCGFQNKHQFGLIVDSPNSST